LPSLLHIGLVQLQPEGTVDANLDRIAGLVGDAAQRGASFVLLPEYACCLDGRKAVMLAAAHEGDEVRARMSRLAKDYGIHLLLGSYVLPAKDGRMFNRSLLFSPQGEVVAAYDKLHMFDVELPNGKTIRESNGYVAGRDATLAHVGDVPVGLSICYDLRFPYLYRALACAGAELLLVPSAFSASTGPLHWEVLLRARAIENRAFVIAPATCGVSPGDRATYGHSCIVDPEGAIVAKLGNSPGVLVHAIDVNQVGLARARIPSLDQTSEFNLTNLATS
jgi:predicted amidohydrolase